jgi:hypothetical protein
VSHHILIRLIRWVGGTRKGIEKSWKGLNERTRTQETNLSWLTKDQFDRAKGMKIALTRCMVGLPREIHGETWTWHLTQRLRKGGWTKDKSVLDESGRDCRRVKGKLNGT